MTTIAIRNGTMACDSRGSRGQCILPGAAQKLFRMNDGGVAAIVGDYAPGWAYVDWLNNPGDRSEPGIGDASVIRLHPDKTVTVYECGGFFKEDVTQFCAWGSGMAPALAALHMGASAIKAVQIAMLVDPGSGGEIQSMKVKG